MPRFVLVFRGRGARTGHRAAKDGFPVGGRRIEFLGNYTGDAASMNEHANRVGVVGVDLRSPDTTTTAYVPAMGGGEEAFGDADLEDAVFSALKAGEKRVGDRETGFGSRSGDIDNGSEVVPWF